MGMGWSWNVDGYGESAIGMLDEADVMTALKGLSPYKVGEEVFIQEPWAKDICYACEYDDEYEHCTCFDPPIYIADDIVKAKDWRDPKEMHESFSRSTAIITGIRVEHDDEGWVWVYELKKG